MGYPILNAKDSFSKSEDIAERLITLPVHSRLKKTDITKIMTVL